MPDDPLRPVCSAWVNKIRLGMEFKRRQFQEEADECVAFLNGPVDWLYGYRAPRASSGFTMYGEEGDLPRPTFAMTVNKIAELVQLFGPALYHRNPVRQVNPRKDPVLPPSLYGDPADPNVQALYDTIRRGAEREKGKDAALAALLSAYLNWSPDAFDLKSESRWAIDEAMVKGLGVLWSGVFLPNGSGTKAVGSWYDTVDNLVLDPDYEMIRQAKWVARRHVLPYWEVERNFGLPPDTLKRVTGNFAQESYSRQAEVTALGPEGDYRRKQGLTNDLIVYWDVFSKMGAGGRLSGITNTVKDVLEPFGDFVWLAVADGLPWPLNLPPPLIQGAFRQDEDEALAQSCREEVRRRLEWPTPFWADDRWPCGFLYFHTSPRRLYPVSHCAPGMGELKLMNWAWSFLAGKIRTSCRDFIAIAKSAGEDLKDRIRQGPDYTMLEVESLHGSIDQIVKFLQHPEFNGEVYKVLQGVTANFEKRTGLTELMYGMTTLQLRSAEEAQVKSQGISIRPDDMADRVENFMSDVSRAEALCARWHLTGADVLPVLGEVGAHWWDRLVSCCDPSQLLHSLEYRIEAGSARKPNKARDVQNLQNAMQTLFTPLWGYAQSSGDYGPANALLTAWAKTLDLDVDPFLVKPTPPALAPAPAPAQGQGEMPALAAQPQAQPQAQPAAAAIPAFVPAPA